MDTENMCFQQDGITGNTSNAALNSVRERFTNRIISRRAKVKWSLKSGDFTPLDYFL